MKDGMVVFLDSGTTTLAVSHALSGLRDLTVCTTGLAIALHMCRQPQVRVHMLGGEIDPAEEAAVGLDALEAIGRFRVDIAFLGGGGLSPDGEVTDFTRNGAEQRSRMIAMAGKAYFVLDSSKFGRLTPPSHTRVPSGGRCDRGYAAAPRPSRKHSGEKARASSSPRNDVAFCCICCCIL
ncbi:hypothetical protein Q1M64_10830 (plasmid) [Sinorhizobium meliloti]|nr:hypothetical protein Q1M64_10830 [Sinorhizobium meliloti]